MSTLLAPVVFPLAFGMPVGWEWLIIAGFGLLLFGNRLPEVGKSLGRSIIEFKRGLKGVEEEIEAESDKPALPRDPNAAGRSQLPASETNA